MENSLLVCSSPVFRVFGLAVDTDGALMKEGSAFVL